MDWLAYQQLNTLGPTIFYVFSFFFFFFYFDKYILRVLHSCPSIWKELACHAQKPYYIFISSQYGKKCPKISRPKLQILSTMKDPTFKGS